MIYKDLHGYFPFLTTDKSLLQLKIIKQSNRRITGIISGCILKMSRNQVLVSKIQDELGLLSAFTNSYQSVFSKHTCSYPKIV